MSEHAPSEEALGRLPILLFLVVSAVFCLAIIYLATRFDRVDLASICWSLGFAILSFMLMYLKSRTSLLVKQRTPASVAAVAGLIVAYFVSFILSVPNSAYIVESIFTAFWPLIFGWAIAVFSKAVWALFVY